MIPKHSLPFTYRKISDLFPDYSGSVRAMTIWKGHVLIGLNNGRVALLAPDGKPVLHKNIPGEGEISSFIITDSDKALIGMANNGVWELSLPDGAIRKVVEIPGKYPSIVMAPGNQDEIFIAAHGLGLIRYNLKTGEKISLKHNHNSGYLTNPFITSLCKTEDNKIWAATYSGLACYDLIQDSFLPIDQDPFLEGTSFAVVPFKEKGVLVATSHGLIQLDSIGGEIHKFTQEDGLMDKDIRSIDIDKDGGVWIGTLRGLAYKSPESGRIINYYGGNGLIEKSFDQIVYSADTDKVYLRSNLGITSFSPDSVNSPEFYANVKVTAIYLNGKKILPSTVFKTTFKEQKVIEGSMTDPKVINLPYKDNALSLRLSTMDFRDGANVEYMWRIIGVSDKWNTTRPGESLIYLPHLDPGDYSLEIKAIENNIASELTVIDIHITSPWYISPVAKAFYAITVLIIIALLWTLLKKKRAEKESEAKIKFFMDISHDIRSPITLILSPLESLINNSSDPEVKIKLQVIYRNAQRILSLVNQLLDIRKLEKGKMRLSCRLTNINLFINELVEMFKPGIRQRTEA